MKKPKAPRRHNRNLVERDMIRNLTHLAEFEDYCEEILPKLRQAIKDKKTPDQIYAMVETIAAARLGTIAAMEPDSGKALSAIKDILDRRHGKPTEKKEVSHKFQNLDDEQLQALIETKSKKMNTEEEDAVTH